MPIKKVNVCGFSQNEWGAYDKCNACGLSECDMSNQLMIDERIYNLACKHGWTVGKMFYTDAAVLGIHRLYSKRPEKKPKYVADFLKQNDSNFGGE